MRGGWAARPAANRMADGRPGMGRWGRAPDRGCRGARPLGWPPTELAGRSAAGSQAAWRSSRAAGAGTAAGAVSAAAGNTCTR